jgi:hypothetical protein
MSQTPIHRQKATARTKIAQASFGVLILGGAGAVAVGLRPAELAQAPAEVELPDVQIARKATNTQAQIDPAGVTDRLLLVSNSIHKAAPAPADPEPVVAAQPQETTDLRYLGAVSMGSTKMGLISEGGKQRFVGVGDRIGDSTVRTILDASLSLEAAGQSRTLELAQRSAGVITRGHGRTLVAGARAGQPSTAAFGAVPRAPQSMPMDQMGLAGEISDGSNRYEEIRAELKASGQYSDEATLNEAAAQVIERELQESGALGEDAKVDDKQKVLREQLLKLKAERDALNQKKEKS